MKKILVWFVIANCVLQNANAQVQIQTMLPTVGLVQKNQLWNLVLTNTSMSTMDGRLEMVLVDRVSLQELMTASTAEFNLNKGPLVVNVNKLAPVSYNYIGIEPDKNINSLLPVGSYSACYTFVRNPNSDKREILAEECIAFDVEPLSPPMLSFPADSSVLDVMPTQFSWTPPMPAGFLDRLHYEVMIAEIQPSQKAAEAIEENIPFFSTDQAPDNFLTYPAAQPVVEKDKWYAWQVVARDNKNYAGKSEVWVFKVSGQTPLEAALKAIPYVALQRSGAGKTVAPNGLVRFGYFNQLADTKVLISIADINEKASGTQEFEITLKRGQNYFQKDISKYLKVQEGHTYMLTLHNSAREKWYVMFEMKKY